MTVLQEARQHLATFGAEHVQCCGTPILRKVTDALVREQNENCLLRAFVREVVAIDPLAGGGEAKYFVTADFIARARALVE